MHAIRATVGLERFTRAKTALLMICSLALGAFASPAAAKLIVVTTLDDSADPPFDAGGVCGAGTISDLPGADGLISLREAIIAANNTPGADIITFAQSLSGGIINVGFHGLPLPALCGGHTHLNGDLDGDDVPDITLEGAAFPVVAPPILAAAAGISVVSSHNTVNGLHVQHFPFGIRVRAGDFTTQGSVMHTTITNNILAESKLDGIIVATGNIPGSRLAHTTLAHNLVTNNVRFGIFVLANLPGAGSDTQIAHLTITDNEVMGSGASGILMFSLGDHNVTTAAAIARNTVSDNAAGITVLGGYAGADGNTLDVHIEDNTVIDNRGRGIFVLAGQDNSSHNHVVATIKKNTLEGNQFIGIETLAAVGAFDFPTGASNHNVLEVRIAQNTVKSQEGGGIAVLGGAGSPDGRAGTVADHNQTRAIVMHNEVEGSTDLGIELIAGLMGLANSNTVEVRVAHNTVCHNTGADIFGEGGFTGNGPFPPNVGSGNVLTGKVFQNTATNVVIEDGTPGNTADVMQFRNDPCPL